jgi:hypothetical protein
MSDEKPVTLSKKRVASGTYADSQLICIVHYQNCNDKENVSCVSLLDVVVIAKVLGLDCDSNGPCHHVRSITTSGGVLQLMDY